MLKFYQKAMFPYGVMDKYGDTPLKTAKVTLTATQIKALKTTYQTLIAAPGATKFLMIEKIIAALDYSGAVFTGSNNLEFREENASGTKISADITSAWLNSGADAICETSGIEAQTTRLLNKAIVVAVPTADPGGASATSTLTFTVFYREVVPY
jgi:predicted ATPase